MSRQASCQAKLRFYDASRSKIELTIACRVVFIARANHNRKNWKLSCAAFFLWLILIVMWRFKLNNTFSPIQTYNFSDFCDANSSDLLLWQSDTACLIRLMMFQTEIRRIACWAWVPPGRGIHHSWLRRLRRPWAATSNEVGCGSELFSGKYLDLVQGSNIISHM